MSVKKLPKLPIIAFHIAWKHDLPQHQVNSRVFLVGDTLTTTQTLEYECCHDMGATDHVCPKLMIKTLPPPPPPKLQKTCQNQ